MPLESENAEVFYTNLRIQKDGDNCGTFALDLAMGLRKIPALYTLLDSLYAPIAQKLQTLTTAVSYGQSLVNDIHHDKLEDYAEVNYFYEVLNPKEIEIVEFALLKLKHIPRETLLEQPQLGSLFKNNQDRVLYTMGATCRNKKPLSDFLEENKGEYVKYGKTKFGYTAIFKKAKKINERCESYLRSNQEHCRTLLANRQNLFNPFKTKSVPDTQERMDNRKKQKRVS